MVFSYLFLFCIGFNGLGEYAPLITSARMWKVSQFESKF